MCTYTENGFTNTSQIKIWQLQRNESLWEELHFLTLTNGYSELPAPVQCPQVGSPSQLSSYKNPDSEVKTETTPKHGLELS